MQGHKRRLLRPAEAFDMLCQDTYVDLVYNGLKMREAVCTTKHLVNVDSTSRHHRRG